MEQRVIIEVPKKLSLQVIPRNDSSLFGRLRQQQSYKNNQVCKNNLGKNSNKPLPDFGPNIQDKISFSRLYQGDD